MEHEFGKGILTLVFRRIGSPLSGIGVGKMVFRRYAWGYEGLPRGNGRGISWVFGFVDTIKYPGLFLLYKKFICLLKLVARFESAGAFLM